MSGPKRPDRIDEPHAVERLIERHGRRINGDDTTSYAEGRAILVMAMTRAYLVSWEAGDLNGLGQGVWVDPVLGIKLSVDGDACVRTVLPATPVEAWP